MDFVLGFVFVSVRFLVSTFESFLSFRKFFSRLSAIFFKRAREHEVKLCHVVYEVWLVSYLFFSFQIWYFRKWIITSIAQSKHMRVTRFNPLWVSGHKTQWWLSNHNLWNLETAWSSTNLRPKTNVLKQTCSVRYSGEMHDWFEWWRITLSADLCLLWRDLLNCIRMSMINLVKDTLK